ncbi:hypothetical protein M2T79_15880 [Elizabethkingia miricola]|uniref:hypothetical protein n=1 Tax=Elizabethkingia miricola TaxID=172045 RepID=UPI002018F987|nr:hypothetical protein [Elizabethkingia miricola]MCL1658083.1 hypothetical protein [Elizabethkingia miricola]
MKRNLLSYIALIISIIAISISCFIPVELKIDAYNSIVATLSILITILIGWQIYTFFDYSTFKKESALEFEKFKIETDRNISERLDELKKNEKVRDYILESSMAAMYQGISSIYLKTNEYVAFFENMLQSIISAERINNVELMNSLSKHLISNLPDKLEMSEFDLSRISVSFYKGVNNWNKTLYYKELEKIILNIKTNKESNLSQLDSL